MEINNTKELVKLIQASDEEKANNLLESYHNIIVADAIESSWEKSRRLMRFVSKNRRERLKKTMLAYDDVSGAISILNFTRFLYYIDNVLKEHNEKGCEEVKECIEDVEIAINNNLANLKIDFRSVFSNED